MRFLLGGIYLSMPLTLKGHGSTVGSMWVNFAFTFTAQVIVILKLLFLVYRLEKTRNIREQNMYDVSWCWFGSVRWQGRSDWGYEAEYWAFDSALELDIPSSKVCCWYGGNKQRHVVWWSEWSEVFLHSLSEHQVLSNRTVVQCFQWNSEFLRLTLTIKV